MKKSLITFLILLTAMAQGAPECNYNFQITNATIMLTGHPQIVEQQTSINRGQHSPDGRCKVYRVFFGKGLANSYQRKAYSAGKSLNYNLHPSINKVGILKDFNDAVNSNEFLQGNAPDKFATYNSNFFVAAPGLDNVSVSSGSYTDVIQASIYGYNVNSGLYLFEDTVSMTLVFLVSKKIQVSLIDENGTFDPSATTKVMDFGNIVQGSEQGADLRVVSNTPYHVKISSLNNGRLKHSSSSTIDYTLKINGNPVGLSSSSGNPVTMGPGGATSSAGDRYNLRVRITGNPQNMPAGLYQDAITISAIAN